MQDSQLNKNEIGEFINVFKHYTKGKWVYPGAIGRVTKIPIDKVYQTLDVIEREGIIKSYFEVICSDCKKTTSMVYPSIDDIPPEYFCDNCGYAGSAVDAVLIYKVVKDE